MKFVRKLSKKIIHNGEFGAVCVPKRIIDLWKNVNFVEILFDEKDSTLVITPYGV